MVMSFIWKILQDMLLVNAVVSGLLECTADYWAFAAILHPRRVPGLDFVPVERRRSSCCQARVAEPNALEQPLQEKKDKEWRRIVKTMALLEVLVGKSSDALGLYGCDS